MNAEFFGPLWTEAARNSTRTYLLVVDGRFSLRAAVQQAMDHKNVWIGLSDQDVTAVLTDCDPDVLAVLSGGMQDRLVYASLDGPLLTSFRAERLYRLASALPRAVGEKLLYQNAERLYQIRMMAP